MRRREFIVGLGAVTWPLAGRAQQRGRVQRIGVLVPAKQGDPVFQERIAAFVKRLDQLGWTEGRNLQIDYRFVDLAEPEQLNRHVAELIASAPDMIVAPTTPAIRAVQLATRAVPIVFPGAFDPVGAGIVESLARPGGNATGFANSEFSAGAKYLELLKEMVPNMTRAVVLRDPTAIGGIGTFGAIQAAGNSLRVEVTPLDNRNATVIERGITDFAGHPNGGIVAPASVTTLRYRDVLINLAARYKLPAVYGYLVFAYEGGLLSFGPDLTGIWRESASYVDRILKGEKPGNLPVQLADKFTLVINLKTAKTLGLTVPETLLATADEVIQ
jgi:putative tryptophan/tyrosine transport system substrate-binding protein